MLTDAVTLEDCNVQPGSVSLDAPPQREKKFLTAILEEILSAEESLRKKDGELATLLKDDSIRLGAILDVRRDQSELNAYLKGLKFSHTLLSRLLNE